MCTVLLYGNSFKPFYSSCGWGDFLDVKMRFWCYSASRNIWNHLVHHTCGTGKLMNGIFFYNVFCCLDMSAFIQCRILTKWKRMHLEQIWMTSIDACLRSLATNVDVTISNPSVSSSFLFSLIVILLSFYSRMWEGSCNVFVSVLVIKEAF